MCLFLRPLFYLNISFFANLLNFKTFLAINIKDDACEHRGKSCPFGPVFGKSSQRKGMHGVSLR